MIYKNKADLSCDSLGSYRLRVYDNSLVSKDPILEVSHIRKEAYLRLKMGVYVKMDYSPEISNLRTKRINCSLEYGFLSKPKVLIVHNILSFSQELLKEIERDEILNKRGYAPAYEVLKVENLQLKRGEEVLEAFGLSELKGNLRNYSEKLVRSYNDKCVRYVSQDSDQELMIDGRSWDSAYNDIQRAIDDCKRNGGGEVWVKNAKYVLQKPLILADNVIIRGGFQGDEAKAVFRKCIRESAALTVISGNGDTAILEALGIENFAVMEFFEFAEGALGDKNTFMHSSKSNLHFYGCNFKNNHIKTESGSLISISNSMATFSNCNFIGNEASAKNGSMLNMEKSLVSIDSCVFEENNFAFGELMNINCSTCTFLNNIISKNTSLYSRALVNVICSHFLSANSTIASNSFDEDGGCFRFFETKASFLNNAIFGNKDDNGREISIDIIDINGIYPSEIVLKNTLISKDSILIADSTYSKGRSNIIDANVFAADDILVFEDGKRISSNRLPLDTESNSIIYIENPIKDPRQFDNYHLYTEPLIHLSDEIAEMRAEHLELKDIIRDIDDKPFMIGARQILIDDKVFKEDDEDGDDCYGNDFSNFNIEEDAEEDCEGKFSEYDLMKIKILAYFKFNYFRKKELVETISLMDKISRKKVEL